MKREIITELLIKELESTRVELEKVKHALAISNEYITLLEAKIELIETKPKVKVYGYKY